MFSKLLTPTNFVSVSAKPEEIYNRRMSDDTRNRDKITLANIKKELDAQSGMISACASNFRLSCKTYP